MDDNRVRRATQSFAHAPPKLVGNVAHNRSHVRRDETSAFALVFEHKYPDAQRMTNLLGRPGTANVTRELDAHLCCENSQPSVNRGAECLRIPTVRPRETARSAKAFRAAPFHASWRARSAHGGLM